AQGVGATAIRIGASAPYASYVERGTRRMKARPFLAPAAALAERSLKRLLVRALPRGEKASVAALTRVAEDMKSTAQGLAPVRTGNLRSSLYYRVRR
ncbi:MAG TPA: hypothetical protein VNM48_10525, partial [Chloroflexota bacterium]|nr:hypothetical protein [Chloroflexota bacterium]